PLWLDHRARRAFTERSRMEIGVLTRATDLRLRLRTIILGRAARALRHCRRHDGHHPTVYGAVGNHLTGDAEADRSPGHSAPDRDWRCRRSGEPLIEPPRDIDRRSG